VFGQYRTPNSDVLVPADPQWVIVRIRRWHPVMSHSVTG
jgi:hypothetical protein